MLYLAGTFLRPLRLDHKSVNRAGSPLWNCITFLFLLSLEDNQEQLVLQPFISAVKCQEVRLKCIGSWQQFCILKQTDVIFTTQMTCCSAPRYTLQLHDFTGLNPNTLRKALINYVSLHSFPQTLVQYPSWMLPNRLLAKEKLQLPSNPKETFRGSLFSLEHS